MAGPSSGYMRELEEEEEVQVNVKEEETGQHSRSFAIFDSPSKLRFAPKSPQFYDKHVSFLHFLHKPFTISHCIVSFRVQNMIKLINKTMPDASV